MEIRVMRFHANPDFRAQAWDKNLPGQIEDTPVTATTPPGNTFDLRGNELRIVDVRRSDADKTSVLHAPSIRAGPPWVASKLGDANEGSKGGSP